MFELSFEGPQPEESEALTDITAEFTCGEDTWKVKGSMTEIKITKCVFYHKNWELIHGK